MRRAVLNQRTIGKTMRFRYREAKVIRSMICNKNAGYFAILIAVFFALGVL